VQRYVMCLLLSENKTLQGIHAQIGFKPSLLQRLRINSG
jgi:hypothetical protein